MIGAKARWLEGFGSAPRAHLAMPRDFVIGTGESWCGVSVYLDRPAPYLPRCKACLACLEKFQKEATVPPPMRVVTTVQIVIEHNAEDQADSVLATALRRCGSPSWEVIGEVVSSQPKGTT